MNIKDLKQYDGAFGLLVFDKTDRLKQLHGKIKCIDDEKNEIVFKATTGKVFKLRTSGISSFTPKEMLPEITEARGEEIIWDGGILIYKRTKNEYNPNR